MKKLLLIAFAALAFAACSDDKPEAPVAATGIALDRADAETVPGKTIQLVAAVTPSDAVDPVTWTSDNEAVATVSDSGLVETLSAGEATVTAECGEFTAKCVIRVNELISFEAGENMVGIDGEAVILGTISVVSGKNTATFPNVYWAKEYTETNSFSHRRFSRLPTEISGSRRTIATARSMEVSMMRGVDLSFRRM